MPKQYLIRITHTLRTTAEKANASQATASIHSNIAGGEEIEWNQLRSHFKLLPEAITWAEQISEQIRPYQIASHQIRQSKWKNSSSSSSSTTTMIILLRLTNNKDDKRIRLPNPKLHPKQNIRPNNAVNFRGSCKKERKKDVLVK